MRALPLALMILLAPGMALAHAGDHGATGWHHALTEADHLLALAGLVVLAVIGYRLWSRR